MVRCWIFSSKNRKNIHVAFERLVWGFWDRDLVRSTESKLVKNWRPFLRLYNSISSGDSVFFQIARTGEMHAVGVVRDKYYDDQTPIWDQEVKGNKVIFPWRVSFHVIIYSEEPFARLYTGVKNYVDGYGIGELPYHEAKHLLDKLGKEYPVKVNVSLG